MKRFAIPALVAGVCSLAIALPQPQDGQGSLMFGGELSRPNQSVRKSAPPPQLTAPIVHQGIPGERIEGGIYVERSLVSEDRVYDLSLGARPTLPVQRRSAGGGSYQTGCPCPTGARAENEPDCGLDLSGGPDDTTNGGCNFAPELFGAIKLGDVICGTVAWDVNGMGWRDIDWFETVLTTETTVTFSVQGDGFLAEAYIISAPCPGGVIVFDDGLGCEDPATVSATLPAGTYYFVATPSFANAPIPCGTTYTATLTGGCELYTSAAAFDAANPGLTLEDLTVSGAPPGSFCIGGAVVDSTGDGGCVLAGDIEPGITFTTTAGSIVMLGSGVPCSSGAGCGDPSDPTDNSGLIGNTFGSTQTMTFTPPVRSAGFHIENCSCAYVATIDVFGVGGGLLLSTTTPVDDAASFWGISCDEPIESIAVTSVAGEHAVLLDVRFGGEGDCEFITNETQFDTRFPGLAVEDFEDTAIAPGAVCLAVGPWDSTTTNACVVAGEIEEGLEIDSAPSGGSNLGLLGIGYAGTIDSNSLLEASGQGSLDLRFDPPVTRVGLDLETVLGFVGAAGIEVYDPSGTLISSTAVDVPETQTFLGIACDQLIGRVGIVFIGGAFPAVDNIRYGTGCTVIEDADDFDNLYPDLAFEDFEDGNVAPLGVCFVAVDPVDSTGDGSCFDPLAIEPGMAIGTVAGSGVILAGDGIACGGVNPVDTNVVGPEFFGNEMELTFTPGVRQVGFDFETCSADPTDYTITAFGAGGKTLASATSTHGFAQSFFGIACDEAITSVTISAPGDVAFLDNIRFGTSKLPFTRFCVEESVASVNTGLKTKMVLESQDGSGALLPFDKSIAGNGVTNRFMMIAKDAPGPGNGGANNNIGYFLMGTGANTFVPPGSIGPICVAPGIKRYIGPVNMTSETITFHDEVGTPTTLVGQGFSRAALGAGAHFIGTNIGGSLGFHWSFQAWHRDSPGDSNLSDAIAVDFVP